MDRILLTDAPRTSSACSLSPVVYPVLCHQNSSAMAIQDEDKDEEIVCRRRREEEEEADFISVVNTNEDPPNAHQAQGGGG